MLQHKRAAPTIKNPNDFNTLHGHSLLSGDNVCSKSVSSPYTANKSRNCNDFNTLQTNPNPGILKSLMILIV